MTNRKTTFKLSNGTEWPDEHVERLGALYTSPQKLSASKIADMLTDEFGVSRTRNAVLGKAHRMKMTSSREEENKRRANKRRQAREAAARNAAPTLAQGPLIQGGLVFTAEGVGFERTRREPAPLPVCEGMPPNGVTLAELRECHCRWPFGEPGSPEFRYCGERRLPFNKDTGRRPAYCAGHNARSRSDWQPRLVLGRAA